MFTPATALEAGEFELPKSLNLWFIEQKVTRS